MADAITGAESLVRSLECADVDVVFGIPGGAILPAYDPLMDSKSGVCMATSGPGATNLVTPIADAHMDSVPMVAITGQVSSAFIGSDAFQEADIRGITMPITKHNYLVTRAADIPRALKEAFHLASTGRPGPVLVDITKDAMQATSSFTWPDSVNLPGYRPTTNPHSRQIKEAARMIVEARRPVFYVGGGVIRAGASKELRACLVCTAVLARSVRCNKVICSLPWAPVSTIV